MPRSPATAMSLEVALGLRSAPEHCAPSDAAELAESLAEAHSRGRAVVPWGGGTEQEVGAPPRRADLIMDTRGLSGIIAYAPEDLTLSVHAGTTLAEIDAALGAHRQFLPLDLPLSDRATIGGVVATAAVPVRRLRYGGVRDLVIGLEVALPDGARCKSGGRVVKNVAGYDLCKLFAGSLGTLGVITAVNVKVQPVPQARAVVAATFTEMEAALRAGAVLAASSLGFGALILSHEAIDAAWTLEVLAEGFSGTVARQVLGAAEAIEREGGQVRVDQAPEAAREALVRLADWRAHRGEAGVLLHGTVAPAKLAAALTTVDRALGGALRPALQADAGSGTFFVRGTQEVPSVRTAVRTITALRTEVVAAGGSLVIAGGPAALRAACDPWGAPPQLERLARTLKERIDPDGMLNPGRFAYGI